MKKFFHEAKRVFAIAKKPDRDEYLQIAKVAGLGILLIGFVGFALMLVNYFIQGILTNP